MIKKLDEGLHKVSNFCVWSSGVTLFLIAAFIFIDVPGRYVSSHPITGSQEIVDSGAYRGQEHVKRVWDTMARRVAPLDEQGAVCYNLSQQTGGAKSRCSLPSRSLFQIITEG